MVAIYLGKEHASKQKKSTEEVETSSEQQQLFLFNWGYIDQGD